MTRKNQVRLGIESLECRDVPAVFAHFAANTGTLTVTITDGNAGPAGAVLLNSNSSVYSHQADIYGDDNGSTNRVRVNGFSFARDNGPVTAPNANNLVRKSDVQRIVVNGSASADTIRLDLIGPGRDWNNLNGKVTVNAEGGNDILKGSGFNDKLYGGSGNDDLYGNSGDDGLYGGGGRDYFNGGNGYDTVYDYQVGTDFGVWTAQPGVERVIRV